MSLEGGWARRLPLAGHERPCAVVSPRLDPIDTWVENPASDKEASVTCQAIETLLDGERPYDRWGQKTPQGTKALFSCHIDSAMLLSIIINILC
jgi:hypothetical protein